jgi:hypothetical protein
MARKPIEEQIREGEERLKQLKAKAAQLAAKERAALKAKTRQEDTRKKIQHGGLVVLAGLADIDKGVLLGALLDVAERLNGDQREAFMSRAKARGDHLLATQAQTNEKSAAAQAQD